MPNSKLLLQQDVCLSALCVRVCARARARMRVCFHVYASHVFFSFLLICGFLPVCFLKRKRKEVWSWMNGEDLGGDKGGKTMVRIY